MDVGVNSEKVNFVHLSWSEISQTSTHTPGNSSESKELQNLESSRWSCNPSKVGNEQRMAERPQLLRFKKPSPTNNKPRSLISRPCGTPQFPDHDKEGPMPYKEPSGENLESHVNRLARLKAKEFEDKRLKVVDQSLGIDHKLEGIYSSRWNIPPITSNERSAQKPENTGRRHIH
ncbi:hypothetical protein OnM2_045098 [Erysiphe neolycopersici]|uniref:Uncharacterized protein n=1 Tax=Erysiphe neolycopersici TaxID=212602 RepID=A0A420HUA2_9PEZI|nr:hypothetical protein OnM2_045098 [Erysiphe neolycopersici]